MTGPESLLARWSRRKSDARTSEGDAGSARHDSEAFATRSGVTQSSDVPPPFDLASLPTLDSISAETDLRAAKGFRLNSQLQHFGAAGLRIRQFATLSDSRRIPGTSMTRKE